MKDGHCSTEQFVEGLKGGGPRRSRVPARAFGFFVLVMGGIVLAQEIPQAFALLAQG